ncbi:MAG: ChaN family lipoprotein [Polyangiaceae bacterium]|nr:ChaN family lipoprotein [Polyangiaceae bacterium]
MRVPLLALALLAGCATSTPPAPATPGAPPSAEPAPPPPAGAPWTARLDADSPLVGRLWDPRARRALSLQEFLQRAAQSDFVLLGEKHDHPDHHRLQALVLSSLVPRKPTVVFEMIDLDQQQPLDAFLQAHPRDHEALGSALSWEQRGWPAWPLYQPIAAAALGAGLPLRAGNISPAQARAVVKNGLASLGEDRVLEWGLKEPMEATSWASLQQEMKDAHCGHLPDRILPGMADAQRARDAAMAHQLLAAGGPAVLIAGAGHTRSDRGVPLYLRARRPGVRTLSVAFREVQAGQREPDPQDSVHDLLWFTPRLDDSDPCAAFRKG